MMLQQNLLVPYRLYLQKRSLVIFGQDNPQHSEARIYQLLNLINSGTSFSSIFFVLGRYYQQTIRCVQQLNQVLAQDIAFIYRIMSNQLVPPVTNQFLEDLGGVHEKMYVIFYNCYFCQAVAGFRPKWIKTDVNPEEFSTRKKKDNKSVLTADTNSLNKRQGHIEESFPEISEF